MNIGKNIRNKRKEFNMSQDELAEKLFVTRQTISNYENGKRNPTIETLQQLSVLFNCELEELIYGKKDDKSKQRKYIIILLVVVICYFVLSSLFVVEKEWTQKYYTGPFFQWSSLVFFFPLLLWVVGYCLGELSILNRFRVPTVFRKQWIHRLLIIVSFLYVTFCLPYVLDILLVNLGIINSPLRGGTIFAYAHYMIWIWMFYRYVYLIFILVGFTVSISRTREE